MADVLPLLILFTLCSRILRMGLAPILHVVLLRRQFDPRGWIVKNPWLGREELDWAPGLSWTPQYDLTGNLVCSIYESTYVNVLR